MWVQQYLFILVRAQQKLQLCHGGPSVCTPTWNISRTNKHISMQSDGKFYQSLSTHLKFGWNWIIKTEFYVNIYMHSCTHLKHNSQMMIFIKVKIGFNLVSCVAPVCIIDMLILVTESTCIKAFHLSSERQSVAWCFSTLALHFLALRI
jgi:hypothetical protein